MKKPPSQGGQKGTLHKRQAVGPPSQGEMLMVETGALSCKTLPDWLFGPVRECVFFLLNLQAQICAAAWPPGVFGCLFLQ